MLKKLTLSNVNYLQFYHRLGRHIGDPDGSDPEDEGWDISSRVTYAPIDNKSRALHFGLSLSQQFLDMVKPQVMIKPVFFKLFNK